MGRSRRNIAQQHRLYFTHVDAELERGGTAEHVDLASHELVLDAARFGSGPLSGVLLDGDADRREPTIQARVVVIGKGAEVIDRPHGPRTLPGRADSGHRSPPESPTPV